MSWHDYAMNPRAIGDLYDVAPLLSGTQITTLTLSREGPTMQLCMLIRDLPSRFPRRWAGTKLNMIELKLDFDLVDVQIGHWTTENIADVDITARLGGGILVRAISPSLDLIATCSSFRISGIAPLWTDEEA